MLWISITAVTDAIASALFDAGHVVISGGAPIVIDDVSSVYQYILYAHSYGLLSLHRHCCHRRW